MKLNHKVDKEFLSGLAESLNVSERNLKRDEDNYWNLVGRRGKIDTDSEYWYVRMECPTSRRWNFVKSSLSFMSKWQDGDDEGALRLDRYPTEEETQKIRKLVGFSGRRKLSQEEKENLINRLK